LTTIPTVQVRATAIVLKEDNLLIVKQSVPGRMWSLPGGRLEHGEDLASACKREVLEETGLIVSVGRLLYLCDEPTYQPPLLHITFRCEPVGGELRMPTNEFDANPISAVEWVSLDSLEAYGFSAKFVNLVKNGFPGAGSYMGSRAGIGLGL